MESFKKTYKYMKGIYEAKFFDQNRNLLYYDNKLTDANIASSVNMGEINAGIGNYTVIQLPDTAKISVTMTAADVDLRSRQLQTGGTMGYNGITDTVEILTATTTALTASATPVAPYGSNKVACYINGDGTVYELDPLTKQVKNFTATVGSRYTLRYYVAKAASEVLDIKALFSPVIGAMEIKMPVFEAPIGGSELVGTKCGYWHSIIPRFQFSGEMGVSGKQTEAASSSLTGTALGGDSTEDGVENVPSLIYMVYEPIDPTAGVRDICVIGGGSVSVAVNKDTVIPVRYVMADGGLSIPSYADLSFTSAAAPTASVSAAGLVHGVAAGDTEITIKNTAMNLTAFCNVKVTAV